MLGVWVTRRQYMTRDMSGGGWRDSSRVTCLLTLRKRSVPPAADKGAENGARLMGGYAVRVLRQIREGAYSMARKRRAAP
jgi:hypothetical protein